MLKIYWKLSWSVYVMIGLSVTYQLVSGPSPPGLFVPILAFVVTPPVVIWSMKRHVSRYGSNAKDWPNIWERAAWLGEPTKLNTD